MLTQNFKIYFREEIKKNISHFVNVYFLFRNFLKAVNPTTRPQLINDWDNPGTVWDFNNCLVFFGASAKYGFYGHSESGFDSPINIWSFVLLTKAWDVIMTVYVVIIKLLDFVSGIPCFSVFIA